MESICSQCGRSFPETELVTIKGAMVCADCKPLFLKRIQEGDTLAYKDFNYKGFWIRYYAKVMDFFVLFMIQLVVVIFTYVLMAGGRSRGVISLLIDGNWFVNILSIVLNISYNVYFNGKYGATPGKMVIKAKIVNTDGTPISYGKALARYFAEWLSSVILLMGYIMAAFDSQKRALHDRICGTLVVQK